MLLVLLVFLVLLMSSCLYVFMPLHVCLFLFLSRLHLLPQLSWVFHDSDLTCPFFNLVLITPNISVLFTLLVISRLCSCS